ncbi:hypothetical protein PR048_005529 [Dryococelus australis]|uniref:Uncharacterized protein n=1 Tax=Dryococelus australis TaxID=614101 RepID=A0ABQ9I8F5_9NEOP|nr:hypothetical protein PR048_005529 [Dryococelus australis]
MCHIENLSSVGLTLDFSHHILSCILDRPTRVLWNASKQVLWYMKGTSDKKLVYQKCPDKGSQVITFAGAEWGSDNMDCKSVSGCGNLVLPHTIALMQM